MEFGLDNISKQMDKRGMTTQIILKVNRKSNE